MNGQSLEQGRATGATASREPTSPDIVYLFPGLGNQHVDMGLGLYQTEVVFREAVDRCAERLRPHLGLDLLDVLYPRGTERARPAASASAPPKFDLRRMLGRAEAPASEAERRLNETWLAQPAMFTIEYALAELLVARGFPPKKVIGYSLGEYVAACVAGVMSLEDSLRVVATRATKIDALPAGGMLAVPLAVADVLSLLDADLSLSAVNGPELCVVAGPLAAVDALQKRLESQQLACRRIPTTHAFHSRMMESAAADLQEQLRGVSCQPARIPCISNLTGGWLTESEAQDPSYWSRHLCETVRFSDGLATLFAGGPLTLVEVGPGQALTSVVQQHPAFGRWPETRAVAAMRYEYDTSSDETVLERALGVLATPPARPAVSAPPAAPSAPPALNEVERELAPIWLKLLRRERLEPDASFFESGGNSLLATQLLFRIRKVFGVEVSLRSVFAKPRFVEVARLIAAAKSQGRAAPAKSEPAPPALDSASPLRRRLPNGLEIFHQSEAETRHFYEDIFEHRGYLRCGVHLPPGSCVFDVGANIGLFTLFAASECRDARLFSFEPAPPLFAILKANVEQHRVNAKLFNCGVSRQPGRATFTFYPASSGMSSFYPDLDEEKQALRAIMHNQLALGMEGMSEVLEFSEELLEERFRSREYSCELRTLSDVIGEQRVERIDLLKIDVQKAEEDVLRGIDAGDWPKIAQVVAEVHDIEGRLALVSARLQERGFRVEALQDELYRGSNIFNLYARRA